jgi:CRISPR/Cas system CSM-associated protein Csm5 (group 7 of RAMP superfamily)
MFICLIWNKQCQKKTANISKLIKEKHIIKQLQHQNNKRHKSVLANMGMVSMPPFSGG